MSFLKKLGLSVLSGVLFTVAWPVNGFTPLIFVAFVPLLLIADSHKQQGLRTLQITFFAYIAFLIWNALTTYWVCYSTMPGGIAAITLLSLFFTVVFAAFYLCYKYLPNPFGLITLPVFWIAFEKFHLNWDLSWPWLTLGNVFSEYYTWVQWYEFTGVFGGSLWVFLVNILFFLAIKNYKPRQAAPAVKWAIGALVAIVLPVAVSYARYASYTEQPKPVSIVVVQPNIDPYNEKFAAGTQYNQTMKFIALGRPLLDSTTDFLVGPETALGNLDEAEMFDYPEVNALHSLLRKYPRLTLVTGASTYKFYREWETPPYTASLGMNGQFYDNYNTAVKLDTSRTVQFSHKTKLVPGPERMPFASVLGFLEEYAMDMGGAVGSLGVDTIQQVFISNTTGIKVAPSICYESVYGAYTGEFVKRGAQLIFVITNDGWWHNSPGHKQHCSYARLRAIENRRSVARSANTGISCFINQRGDMFQATPYWKDAAIKQSINANDALTFYTLYGDYIAVLCIVLTAVAFPVGMAYSVQNSWKRRKARKAAKRKNA